MPQNTIKAIPLTIFDSAGLGAAYESMNSPGFEHPVVYVTITNDSDQDIFISYDSVEDHDIVFHGGMLILFPQMLSLPNNKVAMFSRNQDIFGRVEAPATGDVYIAAYYI